MNNNCGKLCKNCAVRLFVNETSLKTNNKIKVLTIKIFQKKNQLKVSKLINLFQLPA